MLGLLGTRCRWMMKSVDIKLMMGIVLAMLPFGISCADEAEEPPICEPPGV